MEADEVMANDQSKFNIKEHDFFRGEAIPYDEYKFVVEMTDRLSERRQKLHSIFETMLTALLALTYFVFKNETADAWPRKPALVVIALLGIVISLVWDNIIKSYKELIDFRFKMLMEMEKNFQNSIRIYLTEWAYMREKRKTGKLFLFLKSRGLVREDKNPFTFSLRERTLPYAFAIIFLVLGFWGMFMN
jgi:hypothetical protein